MLQRLPMLFTSVAIGIIFAGAALVLLGSEAKARPIALVDHTQAISMEPASIDVNNLVLGLSQEPKKSEQIIKTYISKVRGLQRDGKLRSSGDYLACASIVAKGQTLEDALFSHDLSLCALATGDVRAKQLAATSMDQVLVRMGKNQRFGTIVKDGKILPVAKGVSDSMRLVLGLPSMIMAEKLVKSGKPFEPNNIAAHELAVMVKPTAIAIAVAE